MDNVIDFGISFTVGGLLTGLVWYLMIGLVFMFAFGYYSGKQISRTGFESKETLRKERKKWMTRATMWAPAFPIVMVLHGYEVVSTIRSKRIASRRKAMEAEEEIWEDEWQGAH